MRLAMIHSTLLLPLLVGCASFGDTNTTEETAIGGVIGGITGALIGEHNDDPLGGAIIGATAGALLGNAAGQENERIKTGLAVAEQEFMENAVTVNRLLELTQAGVNDAVIISRIEANGPAQRLTTDDIILLSNSQVAPTVISAYQTPPVGIMRAGTPEPPEPHYPFPIVPTTATGFSIGLDFGN